MYVGTSKGTSTYWFYDFPENRRSPVYDAIQESHPRKRLVQSFLYTLILYKTPIQTYRKTSFYLRASILEMYIVHKCVGEKVSPSSAHAILYHTMYTYNIRNHVSYLKKIIIQCKQR